MDGAALLCPATRRVADAGRTATGEVAGRGLPCPLARSLLLVVASLLLLALGTGWGPINGGSPAARRGFLLSAFS